MRRRTIEDMLRAKERIERGQATPARVREVKRAGKSGFARRAIDRKAFRLAHDLLMAAER